MTVCSESTAGRDLAAPVLTTVLLGIAPEYGSLATVPTTVEGAGFGLGGATGTSFAEGWSRRARSA
jgi:hypothetical protein